MNYKGLKQTRNVLHNLSRAIDAAKTEGRSLRSICDETMVLDPPERMHHPQVSRILREKDNRSLYLQQFFVFCVLLKRDPLALLLDCDDEAAADEAAATARLMVKLPKAKRQAIHALAKR